MHWCATKELTGLCSSSVTVVSYDLVISHTKLYSIILTVLHLAFYLKFSFNQVDNNINVQYTLRFGIFLEDARKL